MKYLDKGLPSLLSRLGFSAALPVSLSQPFFFFTIHYTQSLQTLLMMKQAVQKVGNSTQRFLSATTSCFMLLSCSGIGCLWATVPSEVSCPSTGNTKNAIPQGCPLSITKHHLSGIHLFTCSQISLISLILSPNTLQTLYHVSCLHFLPSAAAILPQTCLKRSDM